MSRGLGDGGVQRVCSEVVFSLKGRREGGADQSIKRTRERKSAAQVCVTVLHSISGCHDYCQGAEKHLDGLFFNCTNSINKQKHTLRVLCAGSLEPMTMRPGPPMLQKLFRCSPSSTGTVDTAKSCNRGKSGQRDENSSQIPQKSMAFVSVQQIKASTLLVTRSNRASGVLSNGVGDNWWSSLHRSRHQADN